MLPFAAGPALACEELDVWGLRQLLERSYEQIGLDRTIAEVIGPAMVRICGRWRGGAKDPSQEYLFSSGAERWMSSKRPAAVQTRAPLALLTCGPGETSTLALFALETLLSSRGWAVENLGSATPATSLRTAVRVRHPVAVVLVAHRTETRSAAVAALAGITDLVGATNLFYGGGAFDAVSDRDAVRGTYLEGDLADAVAQIAASQPQRA
jgi:hypothetical protein